MATDASNVDVAVTGSVMFAPEGTAVPTDPTSAWPTGWEEVGFISENGLEEAPNDTTKDVKAWQHGVTVRVLITGHTLTFKFTAIETNRQVLEVYYPGSVFDDSTPGQTSLKVLAPSGIRHLFGFDIIDGADHMRAVIGDGQVTQRGAIVYKNDEPIGYEITVTAYPVTDGDGDSVLMTKMWDKDSVAAGS